MRTKLSILFWIIQNRPQIIRSINGKGVVNNYYQSGRKY